MTFALVFLMIVVAMLLIAIVAEGSDTTMVPAGNPWMEDRGLVHSAARVSGVRLGKAPNQGTRLARFRRLDQALGDRALRYADARMAGSPMIWDVVQGRTMARMVGG